MPMSSRVFHRDIDCATSDEPLCCDIDRRDVDAAALKPASR